MRHYQKFHYHAFIAITIFCVMLFSFLVYKTYYHAATTADLIIHNGTLITMDLQRRIIPHGAVAVKNDTIVAVGTSAEILQEHTAHQTIDAQGCAILPGFINGHTHVAMTLFRGVADDLALEDWLHNHIFPLEKKFVTPDFVYWGTILGCFEMIRGGITTIVDMYLFEGSAAQAFNDIGMRAIAGYNIINKNDIRLAEVYIKKWQHHPLITPAVAPHSPYSCTTEVLIEAKNLAKKYHAPSPRT